MVRRVLAFAGFFTLIGALSLGCSSGFSEESATLRCDQERTANAAGCITDAVYAQCVSCYEECGNDCVRADTCPGAYTCSDGSSATTSSSGGTGGSK
jgi:hypothetical protein